TSGTLDVTWTIKEKYFTEQPPCGCFALANRLVEWMDCLEYESIVFKKVCTYTKTCVFEVPDIDSDCEPMGYKYGKFAYWESGLKYPCNPQLYDSSELKIEKASIPTSIKSDFE